MSPKIFAEQLNVLSSGLDFSSLKNRIISSNIANTETPGYKAFRVVMDEKLGASGAKTSPGDLVRTHPDHLSGSGSNHLIRTHPKHLSGNKMGNGNINVIKSDDTSMRTDGNNVDLERELAELSANALYFTTLSRFVSSHFSGMRKVISEGKR